MKDTSKKEKVKGGDSDVPLPVVVARFADRRVPPATLRLPRRDWRASTRDPEGETKRVLATVAGLVLHHRQGVQALPGERR